MNGDTSLFCHHDNESRQDSIEKNMLCLIETAVDKDQDIVLIAKIKNKGDHHDDDSHTGRFWIEFSSINFSDSVKMNSLFVASLIFSNNSTSVFDLSL